MTRDEVITLCQYVAEMSPHQRFTEFTPNVWADVLSTDDGQLPWLTLDDARTAVVTIKRRQVFIDPSDILAEVKRMRGRAADQQRAEAIIGPVRRRQLHDARPVRETIRSILSHHGRPELLPAPETPGAPPRNVPAREQHAALDAWQAAQERPA